MSINKTEAAERMGRAVAGAMHEHWGLFLAEGIILVILGVIAHLPWCRRSPRLPSAS